MLGRAAKSFETSNPKTELAKQLFPSSSPAQNAKIDEQFKKAEQVKKARQSTQSIGGFTGYTNVSNPLRSKSPNIRPPLKRNAASSVTSNSVYINSGSTHNAPSIFSKQGSFQNTPDIVDLSDDEVVVTKQLPVEFDLDDFDDDADLDLDADYDLPKSMPPPPNPNEHKTIAPSPSPYNLPPHKHSAHPPSSQNAPSSAHTWSSSSPSHKLPPAAAMRKRKSDEQVGGNGITEPEPELGPAKKRRTLPWMQDKAEKDEIAAVEEEIQELSSLQSSTSPVRCMKCRRMGHSHTNCPNYTKKGTMFDFTPLPKDKKDKQMPWNNTGSAVAEEKRKFKQKSKKSLDQGMRDGADARHKSSVTMAAITLSKEQEKVRDLVVGQQKSVFFTGSAGTGKSVLMRAIIADLRKKYMREPDRVAVTASTGLAACNIGGVTLHSFGGIGLGKEDVPALVKKIKRNQKAKQRWLRTKILIIDEISMVDGDLFDKLEGIARAMRNNGRPFGGIQLVITGDFFQLPPVPDHDNKARGAKFAFDAGTWATAIHHTIGLTEVFRQKDPVFASMLNEMRLGKITNETIAAFRSLSRSIQYEDGVVATELFPTRNEVENSNSYRMRDLHGKAYNFPAKDGGSITDEAMRDKLLSNMMAPKQLTLKKGAQVMLIKNVDDSLVNGSLGKVVAFMNEKNFELHEEFPEAFDDEVPTEDLNDQGREVRTKLKLREAASDSGMLYPVVQFSMNDGTSRQLLVMPEEWKVELPNGEVQAQRSQLPLILAWALSIHKAQGQTLERVKIDLKKVFEKGQAYVALSRATSQAGLEVRNFDKNKVMAHPRVAEFYNSLYSVNKALEHPTVAKPAPKKAKSYEEEFMNSKDFQDNTFDFDEEELAMAMAAHG